MNLNTAIHWKSIMSFFTGMVLLACIQMEWSLFLVPLGVFFFMVLFMKLAPNSFFETEHRSEEKIFLYPTASYENSDGDVSVKVHGSVYHPKTGDRMRRTFIQMIARILKLSERTEEEKEYFYERIPSFLVDNRRGKRLTVALSLPDGSELTHSFGALTGGDGHAVEKIVIARDQCLNAIGCLSNRIELRTVPEGEQENVFYGFTRIVHKRGVSVVSDIDDTIKDTIVGDPKQCLENSFFRKFRPIEGMPALYRDWEDKFGAEFHYVSSCPFQMWGFVDEFLREERFPEGSSVLRKVRWKDTSFLRLISSPHNHKLLTIEGMLLQFPERKFIFVGDSGEFDPEIYVELGKRYHRQVRAIFIRRAIEPPHKKAFKMPKNVLEYDKKQQKKAARKKSKPLPSPTPSPSLSPSLNSSSLYSPSLSYSESTDEGTEMEMSDLDLSDSSSPSPLSSLSASPPSPSPGRRSSLSKSPPPSSSSTTSSSDELMEALEEYSHGYHLEAVSSTTKSEVVKPEKEEKENERWTKLREKLPSHVLFHVFDDPQEIADYEI